MAKADEEATAHQAAAGTHAHLHAHLERCAGSPPASHPEPTDLLRLEGDERARLVVDLVHARRTGQLQGTDYLSIKRVEDSLLASLRGMHELILCALLREIGATGNHLCGYPWQAAWKLSKRRIAADGVSPELCAALRAMQPAMNVHGSDKNARVAIDRQLWFASHMDLNVREEATDVIRAGLRAMQPSERQVWCKLLEHGQNATQGEPKESWLTKAGPLVNRVGPTQLRLRWTAWATSIAALDAVRLSVGGAETLRGLVWYGTLVRDEELEASIRRLASHPWQRGKAWRPQHDRFIGALAYALSMQAPADAAPIVLSWRGTFGRTTARYAIENALTRLGVPSSSSTAEA